MKRAIVTLLVMMVAATPSAWSQNNTARVTGVVSDSSGGAVQAAEVVVVSMETGVRRETHSNESGNYTVPLLQPGNYEVTVQKSGFKAATRSSIRLEVEQIARVDFVLEVGTMSETVTVAASTVTLDTDSSTIGQVVSQRQIVDLPLNGRNFTQLLLLNSSAVMTNGEQAQFRSGVGDAFSLGGARTASNSYLLDGMTNNDTYLQTPAIVPSIDAIQEFKEQTKTYSAEYGSAVSQINISFRSGSNEVHGTAFYFGRNDALDARNFFDGPKIGVLRQHQYGYTLGGPIFIPKVYDGRNRTFFFANYEGQTTHQATNGYANMPTPDQVAGRYAVPILDPLTQQFFPNNTIPESRKSAFGIEASKYFSPPNSNSPAGNFFFSLPNSIEANQQNYRFDQNFGTKNTFFGRYSRTDFTATNLQGGSPPTAEGLSHQVQANHSYQITYTRTFTPGIVNQARFGYLYTETNDVGNPASHSIEALGLQGIQQWEPGSAFPDIQFGTTGLAPIGGANNVPIINNQPTWDISDGLTVIKGAHTLSMGFNYRRFSIYFAQGGGPGGFGFDGTTSGDPVADMLLGFAVRAGIAQPCDLCEQYGKQWQRQYYSIIAPYFNDEWKVSRKVTLTAGLRWDYNTLPYEERNREAYFNPANGGGLIIADKSIFDRNLQGAVYTYAGGRTYGSAQKRVFAPRLGIAFRPFNDNKTVVRTGAGIFFDQAETKEQGNIFSYPYAATQNYTSAPADGVYVNLNQPFPAIPPAQPANAQNALNFLFVQPAKRRNPYVEQWSFSIEREVTPGTKAEVSYVGMHGLNLLSRVNINQPYPYDANNPLSVADRLPYPNAGVTLSPGWVGWSNYHAFNAKIEHSSGGLTLLAGYTWSKNLDVKSAEAGVNGDSAGWVGPLNAHNLGLDYSYASYDTPHHFVGSFVYELPIGKGKTFLGNISRPANLIVGGWQVNGILVLQAGFPFSINATDLGGVLQAFVNRADVQGSAKPSGFQFSPEKAFDTSAFTQPALGAYGNSARNSVRAPGVYNLDFSAFKNVAITERVRWQLRFESFNSLNHTQFGYPDSTVGSPTFGVITSARPGRVNQIGSKMIW